MEVHVTCQFSKCPTFKCQSVTKAYYHREGKASINAMLDTNVFVFDNRVAIDYKHTPETAIKCFFMVQSLKKTSSLVINPQTWKKVKVKLQSKRTEGL